MSLLGYYYLVVANGGYVGECGTSASAPVFAGKCFLQDEYWNLIVSAILNL